MIIFIITENLTDEERIWEEIHEIKSMPISMAEKKEIKAQLQNATKLRLQGFDQIKWQRRKVWQQVQSKVSEYLVKMELWRNSMKKIEGNFGTGVLAYFLFLRWLMFLNFFIFLLVFAFIAIPQFVFHEPEDSAKCDLFEPNSTQCCYEDYMNVTQNASFNFLDIIQGTGFMENTYMFYGMYTNKIFGFHELISGSIDSYSDSVSYINNSNISSQDDGMGEVVLREDDSSSLTKHLYYDLPLAYILITTIYFLLSLVAIVRAAAREFKDRLVEGEGQFYQYCNLVFGGWDFCIHNEKSALIKHKALFNEIKGLLHSKRMEFERSNRSRDVMIKLILIRIFINLIVLIILACAAATIYILFNVSLKKIESMENDIAESSKLLYKIDIQNYDNGDVQVEQVLPSAISASSSFEKQISNLFFEFLPYLAIVLLNVIVPLFFSYLVQFEEYTPMFVVKIQLFRTVFLRLSSLAVLLTRFYFLVSEDIGDNKCHYPKTPQCWETFVGQQFYKLFITDFVTHIFVTFFINFPRALFARHVNTKFAKFVGEQEFELPKHVLDIVYSQTLCWLGSFYAPFLPAIAFVLNFFMFYIKKFACLQNSKPSGILYRASRSNSLFMFVLLVSYVIAIIPMVYAVAEILPSRSCGPFRGLDAVWTAAVNAFMKLPSFLQNCIFFLGTASFAIPCFVVFVLLLYYYYAVSAANKHMVKVLKNQLILEGHDKQFLLNRLSSFIKQQQEYQRRLKQADNMQRDRDRSHRDRDKHD